jgi:hypothetical protein
MKTVYAIPKRWNRDHDNQEIRKRLWLGGSLYHVSLYRQEDVGLGYAHGIKGKTELTRKYFSKAIISCTMH